MKNENGQEELGWTTKMILRTGLALPPGRVAEPALVPDAGILTKLFFGRIVRRTGYLGRSTHRILDL